MLHKEKNLFCSIRRLNHWTDRDAKWEPRTQLKERTKEKCWVQRQLTEVNSCMSRLIKPKTFSALHTVISMWSLIKRRLRIRYFYRAKNALQNYTLSR